MIQYSKFFSFIAILLSIQTTIAQDIITKDGHNMGPRGFFIQACAGDSLIELNPYQGYSSIEFCNCTADNLLPLLTKDEIQYYISEGRQEELMRDSTYARIMVNCMSTAQKNWKPAPPPQEIIRDKITRSPNDTSVIKSILEIVDYESKFYEIRDDELLELTKKEKIGNKKLEKIREKIVYEVINQPVIINVYKEYSSEDLLAIYDYFKPMTSEELTSTGVRYEQDVLDYFISKIRIMMNEELDN